MKDTTRNLDYWNPSLYDSSHSFVSMYGEEIIKLLAPIKDERILDAGCGTGDLSNKIANMNCQVVGIDSSPNMIHEARQKYPHLTFHTCNATNMPFSKEFDAVFSNAALHWIKPPKQALTSMYESLKPGGRFVAEFGGKGNIKHMTDSLEEQLTEFGFADNLQYFPWYFPSIGEYTMMMEEVGFHVVLAQHFERPTELAGDDGLKKWMYMFGEHMFIGMSDEVKADIITSMERQLRSKLYKDGSWIADYKRIRVIGIKQ